MDLFSGLTDVMQLVAPQGFTSIVDKGHMLVFHSFPHSLPHMLNVDSNFDFGALWPTPKGT
jgi:hypothetical protein